MSACLLHVDAVLGRWRHMWSLSVAVDWGRWEQINAGISPGMVCSLVLLLRASRRVTASGEHSSWWTYPAYLTAKEVTSTFPANSMDIGLVVGIVVGDAVFSAKGIIHRPLRLHLWPQTIVRPWYMIVQSNLEKLRVHPPLHIVMVERSKWEVRPGIMWAACALGGNEGMLSVHMWVESTWLPLGAMMGTAVGRMFVAGAEVVRKWLNAPKTRMAYRLIVLASVVIVFRSNDAARA